MHKYKVVEKNAMVGRLKGKRVYKAQQILTGRINSDTLFHHIAKGSTVEYADVKAVVYGFAESLSEYLDMGYSVDVEDLGIFRPTFGSEEVEAGKVFTFRNLHPLHIRFSPRGLLDAICEDAEFECLENPTKIGTKKPEEKEAEQKPSDQSTEEESSKGAGL